jgi:sec-independent protein translocase protein TatA
LPNPASLSPPSFEYRFLGEIALQDRQPGLIFPSMILVASIMNLAGPDLIIILLIILVLFGAKKLPELARGMGQAVKEFQKAKDEFSDELKKSDTTPATPPNVQQAQATVPRIEATAAPTSAAAPDPNQTINPGNKADQV